MFYNYYPNRKDHRASYYDSRRFDASCRNHHSCNYCYNTRTYQCRRALAAAQLELRAYRNDFLDDQRETAHFNEQLIIEENDMFITMANACRLWQD